MLKRLGHRLILIVVYMALFIAGGVAFMHSPAAPQSAPQRGVLGGFALMACIDTLLVAATVRMARGARRVAAGLIVRASTIRRGP